MSTHNSKFESHPGGAKRLSTAVEDYVLTMQHALRSDLVTRLFERAKEEAGVLPPLTAAEMYDYLQDTDPEFFNWCFPFCAVVLTKSNLGYMHAAILNQFRSSLSSLPSVDSGANPAVVPSWGESILDHAK